VHGNDTLRMQLRKLNHIGIALSSERNLTRLLEIIVNEARGFTDADAGTLYLVENDKLRFEIMQNETLNIRAQGPEITLPPVALYLDDRQPNYQNVSAYVALTGKTVNIPDVYDVDGFNFEGTRRFDARTGYRSQSMLVTPMRDYENEIIGVLQLLNAKDPNSGQTIAFDPEHDELLESLASQAAVAITNVRLIQETEALFEALVRVLASAIDERSPSTAGHIKRVTEITLALAKVVNETSEPPFDRVRFTEDELNELRIAALMHDVGKVTTPHHIVEKRSKLEQFYDLIEVIRVRYDLIKELRTREALERRLALLETGADQAALQAVDQELAAELAELEDEFEFIRSCNISVEWMPPDMVERLHKISEKRFVYNGQEKPRLTELELRCLAVQRGNLNQDELKMMRDHAAVTIRLLSQIPFTRKLRNVARYAGGHHERLNGKGYPLGLTAEELALQTRMMAIADVYEALTASDRSYKTARSQEEALKILGFMVKDGELDPNLVDLFVKSGLYRMWGTSAAVLHGGQVAAAKQEAAPAKQEAAPARQEAAPARQEAVPAQQEAAPAQQAGETPAQQAVPVRPA
jgi:HD-GYP domain-containing protein (c-di-GMP phosphodiesterase class II)